MTKCKVTVLKREFYKNLAGGGKVFGHDDVHIACCNDGVRPVVFRLEAIDDGQPQMF